MRNKIGTNKDQENNTNGMPNRSANYEADTNTTSIKMEPTTSMMGGGRQNGTNHDDEDTKKQTVHNHKFIPHIDIDIKGLSDVFNSYATKKTIATGFFNIALVATNFAQMKQLVAPPAGRTPVWNALNIVLLTFICISLFLQFVVAVILVFLAKQGEFIDEDKRNQLIRSNNGATLLVLITSIINIFINIFISI